jgi:hypothetical protein
MKKIFFQPTYWDRAGTGIQVVTKEIADCSEIVKRMLRTDISGL